MNETDNKNSELSEGAEEQEKKSRFARPARKTQNQALQEALGIAPEDFKDVEGKLLVIKFLDYFSEEPLNFIFQERKMDQYNKRITDRTDKFGDTREEDKLLKKSFEDRKILETVDRIKNQTEEIALSKGIKKPIEKKLRNLNLMITIPLLVFVFALIYLIFPLLGIIADSFIMLPFLCVFCLVPQFVRSSASKKWTTFKEETRDEIYTKNREDIRILKNYVGEILANVRGNLIELKVPLDLIKFSLFNRDYPDLNVINQKAMSGLTEYYVQFEYPEGMDPFPIPTNLQQQYNQPIFADKKRDEKTEKNFVVLADMKGNNGIITAFLPTLKDNLADNINKMLSDSTFTEPELTFNKIIPNYPVDTAIYCICGEIAQIETVYVCNWKDQFKFYLFEGERCKCGDQMYVISLRNEDDAIPEELQEIFSS